MREVHGTFQCVFKKTILFLGFKYEFFLNLSRFGNKKKTRFVTETDQYFGDIIRLKDSNDDFCAYRRFIRSFFVNMLLAFAVKMCIMALKREENCLCI